MADIRPDRSEVFHYFDPDFKLFCDKNFIPANIIFPEMTLHWHEDLEFIYVTSGKIKYKMNGRTITMNPGQGIFVNSRQLHVIESTEEDSYLYCLIFHPTIMGSSKRVINNFINNLTNSDEVPYIVLSEDIPWQKEILHGVEKIYEQTLNETNGELKALSALYDLWAVLWENSGIKKEQKVMVDDNLSLVRQMMEFIQDNYSGKITLDAIAQYGNVGKTKCTELFNKYTHMTPIEYTRTYRIEKGIELLRDTDLTVTEIAFRVGFSGNSFFTETFRELTGKSPKEFRKMIQGEHSMGEVTELITGTGVRDGSNL